MFIRKKLISKTGKHSIQIVESSRVNGTPKQTVIQHIGTAKSQEDLDRLIDIASKIKGMIQSGDSELKIKRELTKELSLIHGIKTDLGNCHEKYRKIIGIHDIFLPILEKIGLRNIVSEVDYNDALINTILMRIANPTSKLAASIILKTDFIIDIPVHRIYRAMDKINDNEIDLIKLKISNFNKKLIDNQLQVMFYDATTLYFESFTEDELKKNGYSKDLKFNQPQVLLTVLVTQEGLPIDYALFPGSTYEGHTLVTAIEFLQKHHPEANLILVADSGILNQENIKMIEDRGLKYILGARIKNQSKDITEDILSIKEVEISEKYKEIMLNDKKRLIISYRDARAKKDKIDRERSIDKAKGKLEKVKNPINLLNNYGYKKFLKITKETEIVLDEDKVALESRWDGLHGVITNITGLDPKIIYQHYRGLWQVEEVFRVQKSDMKIRPIYHWTPSRIKAHVAVSYIAFGAARILQYILKKKGLDLSFKQIRNNLLKTQISILEDKENKKYYYMPGLKNDLSEKIYRIMGVKKVSRSYEYIE